MNRLRQIVGELLEVIDHVVRAERHHVALDRRARDAGDDRQMGIEQAAGNRHRQVGRVVIGDRQHATTAAVL
jgi:hypothetical protein